MASAIVIQSGKTREASMAKAKKKASRKAAKKVQRRKPKTKAKVRAKARPKQKFTISHHRDEDFDAGLRTYAKYRDLGIAPATGGMVQAHVIKFVPPFKPEEVAIPHYHDVDFQMVYVLKGWVKTWMEGQGENLFKEGSSWTQPPRIKHLILDYSDDIELLEVILPADFKTVELAA
jgi:mannose-6-phosphate isomerase-like protein (cupin superfamily)